ncbi:FAD-dependent oxidoreductase [Kineococcus gynurae]|uniref:FAD-dependent oxidoreductase n=1 Tax=Kineococcus gynurae TaxID=452979 RepID=A0ABV5LVE6_9ACTN
MPPTSPTPDPARWPLLFSPVTVGAITLPNRIVSTPHATGWGSGGLLSPAEVDYHVRKARGGVGLVMTFGSASVDPDSAASYGSVSLWDPRNDDELRRLADGVHEHGAFVMSQMTHMGRRGNSTTSGVALRGASDLPEGVHREVPVVLSAPELAVIAARFAASARRLQDLGWDGAEVTSFGGHLIEQFFDPAINHRTDAYGGSLTNRTRFAREVLSAVREATGPGFVIGFRMTADQHLPAGLGPDDLAEIVEAIDTDGVIDLLSVSGGTGATERSSSFFVPGDAVPENANGTLAGFLGRRIDRPVVAAGRILDAGTAEAALREDGVSLVAMTRAIIADPDLPRKLLAGQAPRPCISLNEGCIGRLYQGMPMWCSVNPAIREADLDEPPATPVPPRPDAPTVVVVGGGASGMEAARRSAGQGDRVVLFERAAELGGRARVAGVREGRQRWSLWLDWQAAQLRELGVEVRTGTAATVDAVAALRPDHVILAAGSRPRATSFAAEGLVVADADDVVRTPPPVRDGAEALVLDAEGGFVAPTAAEALVAAGWRVRIATDLAVVAEKVDPTQVWFVRRRLKQRGVELLGTTQLRRGPQGWELLDTESEQARPAGAIDLLVLAGHRQARDDLGEQLRAALPAGVTVRRVGDALAPRTLLDAVAEGARAGVGTPG